MSDVAQQPASPQPAAPATVIDPAAMRWRLRASLALLPIGLIFMAAAAWGAWVVQTSPGLTLLGLDLPEYVKFLPAVRSGQLSLVREVFYLPLVVLGVGLNLLVLVTRGLWPRGLRLVLGLLSIPCALALLPPAWSPATFSQAEYRVQVVVMAGMLLFGAVTLLLVWWQDATVPAARGLHMAGGVVFVACALAAVFPLWTWQQIQPAVATIYNHPVPLGWGGWALGMGALYLALGGILLAGRR